MTATSLLPKAAAAAGISFSQLCRRIVELSWVARHAERSA
jgi:D-alanine-D-alanine ligase-like ATP-grasp enzyme